MRLPLLAFLLLAGPALAQAPAQSPAPAQGSPPATVTVTGQGEIERRPDFARISVAVTTTGETVGEAVQANRTASEGALARIQALGIPRNDIQTVSFTVYETPQRVNPDGSPRPTPRYTASHGLRFLTRDLDGVGRIAGEVLALDGMTFQAIVWGLDRSDEAADEARRRAVADARRQAEVFAGAAGAGLGRLRSIGDGSLNGGPPQPFQEGMALRSAAAPSVPIVPPASVRYGASVQMSWELEGR